MPFALIIIGVVLLVAGVRDKSDDLFTLVKGDFSGPNNFAYWFLSILVIGALGYIEPLKPLSRVFLALVIVVLFVSHGGIFDQFNAQFFQSTATDVTNMPVNLGPGITGNFTGNTANLPVIEQPLAPARPH